jgi:hypothetical protein
MSHTHLVTESESKHREPVWKVEKLTHLRKHQVVAFRPPRRAKLYQSAWYRKLWAVERVMADEAWVRRKRLRRRVEAAAACVIVLALLIVMRIHG